MPEENTGRPCVDCKASSASLTARKRDLCRQCFLKFLQVKTSRQMSDRYRLQNAPKDERRKVLLALSYGVSSLALLHMVDGLLEKQRTSGAKRTAFDLHVVAIDPSTIDPTVERDPSRIDLVQRSYPEHEYTEITFSSIFQYDQDIRSVMAQYAGSDFADDSSRSDEERLRLFRSSLSTATSRTDVDEALLRRLIVAFAQSQGCDGILWGDSDSRLAAKTLAHVSKGKGFSLPWTVSNGISPCGIHFAFPLRDIFRMELEHYTNFALPDLRSRIGVESSPRGNQSSRVMSIDDLLTQYVETQGEKYPGVMANIVRTVDKLRVSPSDATFLCSCCGMPMNSTHETDNAQDQEVGPTCYGCARTLFDLHPPATAS